MTRKGRAATLREITSSSNEICKQVKKLLSSRGYRRDSGRFVTEGKRLFSDALASGLQPLELLLSSGLSPDERLEYASCCERAYLLPQSLMTLALIHIYMCIRDRGGSVLVSAAAGSGKTAVLSERVIRLIANRENPTPADRLLIVTFSNAAAAEMKERIAKKLEELVEQNPADSYLTSQQLALQNATIGTIHAFCLQLIRTNFQQLSLSASLRIADEMCIRDR